MSELRVGASVQGTDGELGRVDALIVDPTTRAVTHLVVAGHHLAPRRLVPVAAVTEGQPEQTTLAIDRAAFDECPAFDEPSYNEPGGDFAYGDAVLTPGAYFLEPYASPFEGWALAEHERIPKGEVSIRRGDEVVSSDGTHVGHVDEFLVDPADNTITHVVLRQGHLFRHDDDVVIPVSSATRFDEGTVRLDLDLPAVEALPKIKVKRHHHVGD
jgi:sporulation protein YlmC with PRC-barrel domain